MLNCEYEKLSELQMIMYSLDRFGSTAVTRIVFGENYKEVAKEIAETLNTIGCKEVVLVDKDNFVIISRQE